MPDDDRKLTYSERDRLRREGGQSRPEGGRARAEQTQDTRRALDAADALFGDQKGGKEGEERAAAVRSAHGTAELPATCRAYFEAFGAPGDLELVSIFLDAGEKDLSVAVLDALLHEKGRGRIRLEGGLKRQVRLLAEDFDDELASRAEDLLE